MPFMANVMTIGGNAEHCDSDTIHQADQGADRQHHRQHPNQWPVLAIHDAGKQNSAERDGPRNRQVETAGKNDRALAKREDQQEG
jgi:hypothetical protein